MPHWFMSIAHLTHGSDRSASDSDHSVNVVITGSHSPDFCLSSHALCVVKPSCTVARRAAGWVAELRRAVVRLIDLKRSSGVSRWSSRLSAVPGSAQTLKSLSLNLHSH